MMGILIRRIMFKCFQVSNLRSDKKHQLECMPSGSSDDFIEHFCAIIKNDTEGIL